MVLVFHGADTYRSRQKLREVLAKFRREVDPQGYNMTTLQGGATSCQAIVSALSASPFMARKRLVLVEQVSSLDLKKEEEDVLVEAIENALASESVLAIWEEELGKTEWKSSVFAALKKSPYVMDFPRLDAAQVVSWMRQKLAAEQVQLENAAWSYVAMAIEDNLYRASQECDKLAAYAQAIGKTTLSLADIKPLLAGGLHNDVFALVDSVSQGRRAEALALLHDQLKSGSHALEINTMLVRQYRILQQVSDGLSQGLSPEAIATLYKMHPFVAKKMSGQARQTKPGQVRRAYDVLANVDRELKGSGLPADLLISVAVAKLVE